MTSSTPDLSLQRWIIGLLWAAAAGLTVTWMAVNWYVQIILITGVLALLLEGVVFIALLRHGLRWLFSRRGLVFAGWLVAGVVSVIVLFYAEENWRGRRAWAAVQRDASARGESLEFSSVFPPQVRDEDNFARAPGVSNLLTGKVTPKPGDRVPEASWTLGQFTDLSAWRQLLLHPTADSVAHTNLPPDRPSEPEVALDVLKALESLEPQFQVFREAAARRSNRFDVAYADGLFAAIGWRAYPYEPLARMAELLCIRASGQLVVNHPEAALEDVLLALRLADCLNREPFWYAHHRRNEVLMRALQVVWEGISLRRWTEPQLVALQGRFAQLDLFADVRWALRGETMLMVNLVDQFRAWCAKKPSALGEHIAGSTGSDVVVARLARFLYPTGWLYQDKAWMFRFYLDHVAGVVSARPAWADDSQIRARCLNITDPMVPVYVVPRFREMVHGGREKALYLNAATRQAMMACALERYRLANGQYPAALEELVPGLLKELPPDPLAPSGGTYSYRQADSAYAIVSVGLNHRDEGGKPSPADVHWQGGQHLFPKVEEGDWVWRQPAPAK